MRNERIESMRQWAILATSTLALMVACLRDPIALTLKAAVVEVLRQELGRYEAVSPSNARWQRHQDYENEALKQRERDLSVMRGTATASETHGRLLAEVTNRLSSVETKLDRLTKEP